MGENRRGRLASNSWYSRLIPISLCDRAKTPATAGSSLPRSLKLRLWKIFTAFAFSIDVRLDSFDPTTVGAFDLVESIDMRALDGVGEDVDVRETPLSVPRENDLLRRGR